MERKDNYKRFIVYVYAILATLFWGYSFVWFKQANVVYKPISIVVLRLLIAAVVLTLFMTFSKQHQKLKQGDWKYFLVLAVFEPFCYFLFESFGVVLEFRSDVANGFFGAHIDRAFAFLHVKHTEPVTKVGRNRLD